MLRSSDEQPLATHAVAAHAKSATPEGRTLRTREPAPVIRFILRPNRRNAQPCAASRGKMLALARRLIEKSMDGARAETRCSSPDCSGRDRGRHLFGER